MIIMKRKRTEIPSTVKKRICELKNGNGKITRQVIVDKIKGEFDVENGSEIELIFFKKNIMTICIFQFVNPTICNPTVFQ